MKVSFIRGSYLNNFEGQNFNFKNQTDFSFNGYSSLYPIDAHVPFSVIHLPSLSDICTVPHIGNVVRFLANRTLGDSQVLFWLEKYITASDIVHTADPHYYYSYQAAQLRKRGKIKKLVSTWWETIPFNNEGTAAKKRIKKAGMENTDMFLCYTEKAKHCLIEEGVDKNRITVISLGVDIHTFKPSELSNEKITLLFVGRLVEEKGILDLYQSFKQIVKLDTTVRLRIIGRGPLEDTLKKSILKDGLTNTVTIEQKSYEEMPLVYQEADIFCVPSKKSGTWEEQYGMVFIEAMASGLPIVSYETGAIPEVVGDCGLYAKTDTIESLSSLIIQTIKARELRVKLGTMGRARAENMYDSQKTAASILKFYKSLCK